VFSFFKPKSSSFRVGIQFLPHAIVLALPAEGKPRVVVEHVSKGQHATKLKVLVAQHKLADAEVNLVLATQFYKSYLIDAPAVPQQEAAEASKWRVKDMLDFDINEAIVDVFAYPEEALRGRKAQLNVRVTRTSFVAQQLDYMKGSGLDVTRIVSADLAVASLLAEESSQSKHVVALLYLSGSYGMLVLVKDQRLYLSRDFDFNFSSLSEPAQQQSQLDQLTLEVQRSFDYFESQMGLAPPKLLKLSTPDTRLPLANMIGGVLGIQIENVSLDCEAAGEALSFAELQSTTYARGALKLIDSEQDSVNFYTEQFRPKKEPVTLTRAALASAVAILIVLVLYVSASFGLADTENRLSTLQAQVSALQTDVDTLSQQKADQKIDRSLEEENKEFAAQIDAYRSVLSGLGMQRADFSFDYSALFLGLARHRPAQLWLTEFSVDNETGKLLINGQTLDAAQIPVYLERLQQEPLFRQQDFGALELHKHEEENGHYRFSLKGFAESDV